MSKKLRLLGTTLAMSLVVGPAAVALSQEAAHASTVGGSISRSEVLQRAQYWVNQGFTYSQAAPDAADPAGKTYRRDCSGLVSMAWHLNVARGLLTNEFLSMAQSNNTMHTIAVDDLQPGDAVVQDDDGAGPDGHIELFAFWKDANHHDGAYVYSFNRPGETVENPYAASNFGYVGFDDWTDLNTFQAIRYNNIADDAGQPSSGSAVFDGRLYEFARGTDGTIKYWYGSGAGWSAINTIGTGISGALASAVFNGSLYLFGTASDGSIKYWLGGGTGWSGTNTIGSGISGGLSNAVFGSNLYLFGRGTDGTIKYWLGGGAGWSGVNTIGTGISGGLGSTVFGTNLYLFGRGTDGAMKYWLGGGIGWSGTNTLGSGLG